MSSGSVGKGKSKSKSSVTIPDWLQPFVNQATGTASSALGGLSQQLRGATADDLVAGFAPAQEFSQNLAIQRALGEGGFFPTAQNTLLDTARGIGVDEFIPGGALETLTGGGGLDFLDPAALEALRSGATQPGVSDVPRNALESTAQGDFLFGGEGFDQAVDAAVRAATPGILSTFGRSGPSRATGGLAETAIARAGIDAFAQQFGQERNRQLGAAGTLADVDLAERGQQLGAAGTLAGLGDAQQGRDFAGAGLLAELGLAERGNQLDAARDLPGIGTADVELLNRVGASQQDLEQLRLMAPIDAQMQLLQAALTGLPISSFLGQKSKGSQAGLQLGFSS